MPGSFIQNDLSVMLVSSDFGETGATYKGAVVSGIFDDDDVEATLGEGVSQIIAQPTFTGRTTDFPSIADGDAMVIRGETFTVKNWKREDVIITLYLERT